MSLLQTLGTGQGYLKAGFLGFPKSGKTFTATNLAIGVRKFFGLPGPIGFFDTEGGVEYVTKQIEKETGQKPVGLKSRSLSDLLAVGRECETGGISVLVVDSVTHIWRELTDAALRDINASKQRMYEDKGWRFKPTTKLEFQHWGPIKSKWGEWTDFYLNSKLHIIICGRAGWEYDFEEKDDGKKELIKTGVKMKTESEFGFEPSLLIEMERAHGQDKDKMLHRATIVGDRFHELDGKSCDNPTFKFFEPHVARLTAGVHNPIDTTLKTETGLDNDGADSWEREKRQRTIFCEEVMALLTRHFPSQSAEDKKSKAALINEAFGTGSWTKVENMRAELIAAGLAKLRTKLEPPKDDLPNVSVPGTDVLDHAG